MAPAADNAPRAIADVRAEVQFPDLVVGRRVTRTEAIAPDGVVGGVDDAIAVEVAGPCRRAEVGNKAFESMRTIAPADDPAEACLEPATVRWLDEVARKAEEGDVEFLHRAGRLFQAVPS